MPRVDYPVALVTGGARRIGAAIVRALHQRGYRIALHYHRAAEQAAALAEELNRSRPDSVFCFPGRLYDAKSAEDLIENCVQTCGGMDILVNNASVFRPDPPEGANEKEWSEFSDIHLRAPLFLCHSAAAALRERRGSIVNLLDMFARRSLYQHTAYAASKGGLAMLTRSLACTLAPEVRVNGVAPGAILLPEGTDQKMEEQILAGIPLRRLGSVEDIAQTIAFLACDATYVTGATITVDGGRCLTGGI